MQHSKQIDHQTALYIQASESYRIVFQAIGKPIMKSRPLKKYAQFLKENGWCCIHRSFSVNPVFVNFITENSANLCLQNGEVLPISRGNLKSVLQWRKQSVTY
jgi:DNA-binding LytR/AlgR family response regulator